jgi:glycosyltransferase involved in cell wall biosynthesis
MNNLSVIIPVSNDITIDKCLSSINEFVEVIIVLNNPSKEVSSIVKKCKLDKKKKFKLIVKTILERNVSLARNLGAKIASSKYIFFMDSDCVFDKKCLKNLLKHTNGNQAIKGNIKFEHNSFWSRVVADYWAAVNKDIFQFTPFFFTPNIMIKRDSFLNLGGFDENFSYGGEDCDLDLRLKKANIPIKFSWNSIVYHKSLSFREDWYSNYKNGLGRRKIDVKYNYHKGLEYIVSRIYPRKIFRREKFMIAFRSLLLAISMLIGYIKEYKDELKGKTSR